MIPIERQPEPEDFSERVRIPGTKFLAEVPQPSSAQWQNRAYWQRVLPDMRQAYGEVCAYSATWIPNSTGNRSIDHFIPKSQQPHLAYEWDNFRYASARFNSRKGTKIILDPFELPEDWFVIDFSSFFVKPNSELEDDEQKKVQETIDCLKLNDDEDLVNERVGWYMYYIEGHMDLHFLQKMVPFIAYEVLRQGISVDEIRTLKKKSVHS